MKIDFRKIDFKQGKYWFPLVVFVPIVAIAYFSCQMFTGTTSDTGMVTDSINTTMPAPEGNGLLNKYAEMEDNLVRGNGYTAINELGENETGDAEDNVYSENEMDRIDREKAAKKTPMMTITREAIPMEDSSVTWSDSKRRCDRSRNVQGRWQGILRRTVLATMWLVMLSKP